MDWLALAIGAGGLVASIVGLIFAFLARRAAKSAEQAANEARNSVSQTLCQTYSQRAITLVDRIVVLHREQRWDAASELYRELRAVLSDIKGVLPPTLGQFRGPIDQSLGQLILIQSQVYDALEKGSAPPSFGESLNSMRTTLEGIVSGTITPGEQESE